MIVYEIMKTELITVTPDDTLGHAANLLRQYQFHHLPVVQSSGSHSGFSRVQKTPQVLAGLLTSNDIDLAVALESQSTTSSVLGPWQERRIAEVMHQAAIRVTPNTSVAAAAQILVERNLNCLPVIEYENVAGSTRDANAAPTEAQNTSSEGASDTPSETRQLLVGLITRSDLLIALARALGAFEPGMQLILPLSNGNMRPLAQALELAADLHIQVRSLVAAPLQGSTPRVATLRLGTINPTPFLVRLQEAHIQYTFADLPG